MPVFVDPRTGERFENVPEAERERARREFGLVTPEEYALEQRPFSEKAAETLETGVEGTLRGLEQLGSAADAVIPDVLPDPPEAKAGREAARAGLYGPEAAARRQRHPIASAIGEGLPIAAGGAGLGMAGTGVRGALGALTLESAASGVSQEAIDATMEKRDFSAKAAAANGLTELAFGALFYGAGRALGAGSSVADEAVPGVPGPRNLLDEIDPGTVPPPVRQRGQPRSAGAAAAANRNYVGDASEEFTDDIWDAAVKSIDDQKLDAEAKFLADPKNADPILELAAMNAADSLDNVRRVVRDDMGFGVKIDDFTRGADEWTPEMVEAQAKWIADEIRPMAAQVAEAVQGTKGLGGFETKTLKALQTGLERVEQSQGAARNIAVDHFKRGVAGVIRDLAGDMKTDLGAKSELVGALRPLHDNLLDGLQDAGKFGRNAELQKGTNAAVHSVIEPLSRIENLLSERLGARWGEIGQSAQARRTRASAIKALFKADPTAQRAALQDLGEAMDGIESLVEARQRSGLSRLENLPQVTRALQELKSDFNLSSVVRTAERRAGEQTAGLGDMAADAAIGAVTGRVPFVGDQLKKGAKGLLASLSTKNGMPKPGSPLRAVLDNRLKAYSRNPDLANAGFSRGLLPEWLRTSLKGHGGNVAGAAALVGGGAALLAPGEAGATELPEQRLKREAFEAKRAALPPEDQAAHISTAETLARVAAQAETRVRGAISELFSGSTRPASGKARAIEMRAYELDVSRAVVRFMGTRTDDPVEAWKEKRELLSGLVADPARIARTMAKSLGALPQTEPEIFMKMVSQTMATVEHLSALAPGPSGKSALDAEGYPPSLEEITAWAGHWVGSLHPLDTIDDLVANDLVPEQLESVRALHADTFELFQRVALGEIGRMRQSGKRIPMHQLEQIDAALDLNGAGEPVLSWDMARLIQMGEQQAAQTGQQPPQQSPMQSKGAERVASSAMASMRPEAGAIP